MTSLIAFLSSTLYYLTNMVGLYGVFVLQELGLW